MNEWLRRYEKFVWFMVVITLGLTAALFWAAFPDRPVFGLSIGLGLASLFGGIIAWGTWSMRARKLPFTDGQLSRSTAQAEIIEVDVTAYANQHKKRIKQADQMAKLLGPLFGGGIGLILSVALNQNSATQLSMPQFAATFVGAGAFFLLAKLLILESKPALDAIERKPYRTPKLELTNSGMRIPLELLTKPAYHLAARDGLSEVEIFWDALTAFEVYGAAGTPKGQFVLHFKPGRCNFGGPFDCFGIIRSSEILSREQELLSKIQSHLGFPISIRTDKIGAER